MEAPVTAMPLFFLLDISSVTVLLSTFTPFDWLIVAIALWSVVRGLLRGLIRELFALLALLAGILVAAWNYTALAVWLARWIPQSTSAGIAAFLLLAFAVTLGVLLVGRLVRSAAHLIGLSLFDRLAGALFGLARASLLGAAILMGCITFLPPQLWLQGSRVAPLLLQIAHAAALLAPADLQTRVAAAIHSLHSGTLAHP